MNNAHTFNPFLCLNTIHNGSQAAVLVGCGVSNPADILRGEAPRPSTCWRGPWTVRALSFATRLGPDSDLEFGPESAPALYKTLRT